jgi:hypothetical protein
MSNSTPPSSITALTTKAPPSSHSAARSPSQATVAAASHRSSPCLSEASRTIWRLLSRSAARPRARVNVCLCLCLRAKVACMRGVDSGRRGSLGAQAHLLQTVCPASTHDRSIANKRPHPPWTAPPRPPPGTPALLSESLVPSLICGRGGHQPPLHLPARTWRRGLPGLRRDAHQPVQIAASVGLSPPYRCSCRNKMMLQSPTQRCRRH